MKEQVNEYNFFIESFINGYIKSRLPTGVSEKKRELGRKKLYKYYYSLVYRALMLHVKYKSATPGGVYRVKANTIVLVKALHERHSCLTFE
jgi:hypothetical protein